MNVTAFKDKLAKTISILFGFPLIIFLVVYGVFLSGLSPDKKVLMTVLLLITEIFVPFGILIYLYKNKKISNMEVTNRSERITPFFVATVCFFVSLLLTWYFANDFLFHYQLVLFIGLITSFIITLFWKISLHAGIATVTSIYLNVYSGGIFIFFVIVIPLVYWARLHLKRHTHMQLLAGVIVNIAILFFMFNRLGYLSGVY